MAVDSKACGCGLEEFFDYKNQIIEDLMNNKDITDLIIDESMKVSSPEELIYKQIFPYEYVPETVENGKTFICCEVDIKDVIDKTYLIPVIYIWVFTHESLLRIPEGGVRVDKIASRIVEELNGSRNYGLGELELKSVKRFSPITDYQGRIITFYAKDFNRLHQNCKPVPSVRKFQ